MTAVDRLRRSGCPVFATYGGKADIANLRRHVSYWHKADIPRCGTHVRCRV